MPENEETTNHEIVSASSIVGKIIGSTRHKQAYAHLVPEFHRQLLASASDRGQAQLLIVLVE